MRDVRRRLWAAAVDLAEFEEVGREGAEPGEEPGDEGVLVGGGQQRVRGALPADGGLPFPAGGDRAERAGAMGRVEPAGRRAGSEAASWIDRHSERARISVRSGAMRSVRATAPTSSDPPENRATGLRAVRQEVGEVLGGVARGGQRVEGEPAEVERVAVDESVVGVLQAGGAGGDHLGASGGELAAAGDEVGVQVRLGG